MAAPSSLSEVEWGGMEPGERLCFIVRTYNNQLEIG
jgi:hypothetical protein